MTTRIVKGAGFSVTSEPGKPDKTKFHVTGFAKGTRELWVVIPGETRFEFVTLPQAMTKEEAIKHVAGLERFQAENYQTALNLERFLEKAPKEPKAKKDPVQKDLVMPTPSNVSLVQHEKKEEEVQEAFVEEPDTQVADRAAAKLAESEAARKAEFVRRMNLAKMKKIAEKSSVKAEAATQAEVAPIVDPTPAEPVTTQQPDEVVGDGLDIPEFLKR